ncbi:branched-chain amino acid ABC transporter, permease [Deferribacter desulfuricans SSM1]|uniref:Branched-chain amino acid ABC transporter, permease n=1 Tax=Deferribacter desulfuricans (strain DSM 14783 / JCM 11476 / NBRC 101012 / SSM1) TaxID=639282 RepID=D3PCS9_DEFDS|nr:branched-chain amino acid ABC transporter permease [Deferribacter desulfuricans]BAI80402.1 branched-chain amino acid ABC transporter, permease [Deferribacter desulfuricans SSM1]
MEYFYSLLILVGISVILSLSLNLISGYCGQISLGHAAFYGTGAYAAAMIAQLGINIPISIIFGAIVAGVFGFIVGFSSLRVKDDFLAITTMGVNFLFIGFVRQQEWLGGEMGIYSIPATGLTKMQYSLVVTIVAIFVIMFSITIKNRWMGFAFEAIADDEDAAETVAINTSKYKLTAFILGTMLAGLAGGLYAFDIRYIGPDSFGFTESISILSMVVVGGIGSVWGVVTASIILSLLPQWLQFISDYKLLLYGGLLFLMMRFSPKGIAGIFEYVKTRTLKI